MKDIMRQIIAERMAEKKLTMTDVSIHLGKNHAYIQQFLERGVPRYLGEVERKRIASYLNIEEELLLPPEIQKIKKQDNSTLQPTRERSMENTYFGPDTVPVLGSANGSTEALILNFDEPIGEIMRHPNQRGMKGSFALFMRGESMYPRYKEGDPIYAIHNRPPSRGQDCVIELANGESFVKCFTKQTAKELICEQYNPPGEWKRKLADIKALHAVVGRG